MNLPPAIISSSSPSSLSSSADSSAVLPVSYSPNSNSPYFNREHPPFKPTDSTEIYNMRQRISQQSSPNGSPSLNGSDTQLLDAFLLKATSAKDRNTNTNAMEEGSKENYVTNVNLPAVLPMNALNESASSIDDSVYLTPNTFPSSVLHSTLNSPIAHTNNNTTRPIPASINAASFSSPPSQLQRGQLTPANLLQSITKQQISQSHLQRSFGSPMAPPSFDNSNGNNGLLSPSRSPQQLYRYSPISTQLVSAALSPPPANAALEFMKSTHVPSFVGISNAVHIIRETSRPSSPSALNNGAGTSSSATRRPFGYAAANGPLPPPVFPRSYSRPNSSMSASSISGRERSNGPSPADLNPPMTLAEWLKATPIPTPLKRNQDGVLLSPEAASVGSNSNIDATSSTTPAPTALAAISTAALLSPASGGASSTPTSSASGSDMQPPLMSASVNSSTPLRTPIASPPSNSPPIRATLPNVEVFPAPNATGSLNYQESLREQEQDSPAEPEEALFTTTTVNLFDIPPSTADSSETDAASSSSSPASSSSSESSSSSTHRTLIEEKPSAAAAASFRHDSIAELLTTDDTIDSNFGTLAPTRSSVDVMNVTQEEEKDIEVVDPVKALMKTDAAAETCASAPPPIPSDANSAASLNTHVTIAVAGAVVVGAAFAAYVHRKWIEEKVTTLFRK